MKKIIAIDFDGTLVEHMYPEIGSEVPHAFQVLHELRAENYDFILWTVRIGQTLREAVDYCQTKGITFWGVNENPGQKFWNGSPKAYAPLYIDDAALGCPLIYPDGWGRPYVDWLLVREMLIRRGMLGL